MAPEADLARLVGLEPDERMLGADLEQLPPSVGQPESLPDSPARRRLVAIGATLTGVSLIGGLALLVLGVVEALSGGSGAVTVAAFVLGALLVGTHWGWVHVAELSANNLESHRNASLLDRRRGWLEEIEPYPRWEVSATTEADGSIAIATVCYRPVVRDEKTFTFEQGEVAREVHSGDEPAATVAERAELVRRQAAADTARERERYEAAHDAYERAVLNDANEEERVAAVRAASEALSEQINSNLRDPPLVE
ncbi:MAG: hypothetical protein QOJ25_463 [Solirubrobacteraceae bacterium]|jgi:hypothetical protein|nr:hypothetical protein [Solirubrobacteraceae bacterium]